MKSPQELIMKLLLGIEIIGAPILIGALLYIIGIDTLAKFAAILLTLLVFVLVFYIILLVGHILKLSYMIVEPHIVRFNKAIVGKLTSNNNT